MKPRAANSTTPIAAPPEVAPDAPRDAPAGASPDAPLVALPGAPLTGLAGLGRRTARGVAWMMAQTVGTRLITIAGQLVLARLLLPEDFGLIGMAYTVTSFAGLLQAGGIDQVLIHRHARFRHWANIGFWMALVLGLGTGLAIVIAAPLAASVYGRSELTGLLAVLAMGFALNALAVVPLAKARAELRFRLLAALTLCQSAGQIGLTVALAAWGFGAYSFVWPQPIIALLYVAALWLAARPPARWNPQLRRWRYLLPASAKVVATSFFRMLTMQGDYIVLGLLADARVVGLYYFAFSMSMQSNVLFTRSVATVLFPALSTMGADARRQTAGLLRAARTMALVAVPACFLLAALADPGIRALFAPKWYPAIPLMQILSAAMAFRVVGALGGSLMYAQGRFGTVLALFVVYAIVFLLAVGLGAWQNGALGVAICVGVYFILHGPFHLYVAIRPGGGRAADVVNVYAPPTMISALAFALATAAAALVPEMAARQWVRIGVITMVGAAVYLPVIRWTCPAQCRQFMASLAHLRRSRPNA